MRTNSLLLVVALPFLLAAFVLPTSTHADEPSDAALDGIWFCKTVNGMKTYRGRRSILIVRGTDFVMVNGTGVAKSVFTIDEHEIDIERFDGRSQPGIYHVDGTTLFLSLGDADGVRPKHYGHKRGEAQKTQPPHSHYRFTRSPTPEGLEILRTALNDEHKRDTILAGSLTAKTQ